MKFIIKKIYFVILLTAISLFYTSVFAKNTHIKYSKENISNYFLSTIVASEIVSGEYSKGTFRMYLTRPISRSEVILSKLIIVYIYTTLMMLFFYLYTIFIREDFYNVC